MKIKVFQSGKGDCLLVTSKDDTVNILIDGGVSESYSEHVAKELNKLRKNGSLDLACVSHIDDDHIGGFLKMIEDLVDWRVYDFHRANGNPSVKKPASYRPPEINEIWHNAFHDLVSENAGDIEDMLAATANILSASSDPILLEMADIAFSKAQAIQLSRRLKPEQLNIPLNHFFDGQFAMFRDGAATKKLGSIRIHMLAPFEQDLADLRTEWNAWLKTSKEQIKKIKTKVDKDSQFLGTSATPEIAYYEALSEEWAPLLLSQLGTATTVLGKREKVTTPNLASIMFLLEEGEAKVLMTGDGHWEDILKGLKEAGKLDETKGLHLDVLKVQHHGSEHNLNEDFCNLITATHYIFCSNGEHENPDLRVIQAIVNSRTTTPAITDQVNNKFTLWFNSNSTDSSKKAARDHMKTIESKLAGLKQQFPKLNYKFIASGKDYFKLSVT